MANDVDQQMNKQLHELQEQIDDLQGRLSYQEDLLQSLNNVIATQDTAIIALQQKLKLNQDKLDDVAYSLESSGNERPPHY